MAQRRRTRRRQAEDPRIERFVRAINRAVPLLEARGRHVDADNIRRATIDFRRRRDVTMLRGTLHVAYLVLAQSARPLPLSRREA